MIYQEHELVKIWTSNINYWRKNGFTNIKLGDAIIVKVIELPKWYTKKIAIRCDFCGKIFYKSFSQIKFDGYDNCSDYPCTKKRIENTCLKKFGKKHHWQNEECKQKRRKTWEKKYNSDHPMKNKDVKNKMIQTNLANYNTPYTFQLEDVVQKSMETRAKHGFAYTSVQEQYYYEIIQQNFSNVANDYPIFGKLLDIVFLDKKIDFEYDGGGHCGFSRKDPTHKNDSNRDIHVISKGWKVIRFVSKHDKLLSADEFLKILNICLKKLKKINYIRYDIEEKVLVSNNEIIYF